MSELLSEEEKKKEGWPGMRWTMHLSVFADRIAEAAVAKLHRPREGLREDVRKIVCDIIYPSSYWGMIKDKTEDDELWGTDVKHVNDWSNKLLALFDEQEIRKEERKDIFDRLGLHENEMGFCEISNHVPWQSLSQEGE